MQWGKFVFALILLQCASGAAAEFRGMCQHDHSVPGLPKAICSVPSCPSGGDCLPPTIQKTNPTVDYFEPLLRWRDSCPAQELTGSCWEVHAEFRLKLGASDPSGVRDIGLTMIQEVNANRVFKRYWGTAAMKDSQGRYDMTAVMLIFVPPGQRLEMSVYELCARDKNGNEGCVLPARAMEWRAPAKP